jgi:hypothetical protein
MTQFISNVKADSHKIIKRNINFFTEYSNVLRHYSRNIHVTSLHNNTIKIYDTKHYEKCNFIYVKILFFLLVYPYVRSINITSIKTKTNIFIYSK